MTSNQAAVPFPFAAKTVEFYFDADFQVLEGLVDKEQAILITDENLFSRQAEKFSGWKTIVLKAGEAFKNQDAVNEVIHQLIAFKADRQSFVVGIGGGVITDIAGYAASVYLRGVRFGFIPTSILAMVDAAVGGKNGVDVGVYKNLVGVINHPEFLLYDYSFLETLPASEWTNGFAEIIKHACIKDAALFDYLWSKSPEDFRAGDPAIASLVRQNVQIKYNVVAGDERESGERKILNFGHTIGHAIENVSGLPHGSAVSIGMIAACQISEQINGFPPSETARIRELLIKYRLPVSLDMDKEKTWDILLHDKKKSGGDLNFVVLDEIGKASVKKIPLNQLHSIFNNL